jgi:arginine/ornithine N-succinyltransferase beta subunit
MNHALRLTRTPEAPAPAPPAQEPGGWWLCAMDAGGRLLGALHCLPEQGRSRARRSFHVGRVVHSAPELGLHQVQTTLQLGHDTTGEAELSGLWLAACTDDVATEVCDTLLQAALASLGEALTPARWVTVELPGWQDAQGRSPFWDGLVRHFLPAGSVDRDEGLLRHGPAFGTHLGSMLPRQLIHAAFLPAAAQQALGRCAASHAPWLAALQRAGFADWRHCRIDDGGPLLAVPRRGAAEAAAPAPPDQR